MVELLISICVWLGDDIAPKCQELTLTYPTMISCAIALTEGVHANASFAVENQVAITKLYVSCKDVEA